MRRLILVSFCIMFAASPAFAKDAPAKLPDKIDLKSFLRVAVATLEQCQSRGFNVSVAIVDAGGNLKLTLRGDAAAPHTPESAERKAYTALTFGDATSKLVELATQHPDVAGLAHLDKVILVGGGLPIRIDNKIIGGIGVAGGTGPGQDEACAQAGLAAL